jgi:hypothetical protein
MSLVSLLAKYSFQRYPTFLSQVRKFVKVENIPLYKETFFNYQSGQLFREIREIFIKTHFQQTVFNYLESREDFHIYIFYHIFSLFQSIHSFFDEKISSNFYKTFLLAFQDFIYSSKNDLFSYLNFFCELLFRFSSDPQILQYFLYFLLDLRDHQSSFEYLIYLSRIHCDSGQLKMIVEVFFINYLQIKKFSLIYYSNITTKLKIHFSDNFFLEFMNLLHNFNSQQVQFTIQVFCRYIRNISKSLLDIFENYYQEFQDESTLDSLWNLLIIIDLIYFHNLFVKFILSFNN